MSSHGAGKSMIGYLYQVRYALFMLITTDDTFSKISIEKFDDISFEENGTPQELIQLKHHTSRSGNLSDKSVDLWRTLKVWIDMINEKSDLLNSTHFLIITTATIPKDSAADYICKEEYDKAYALLKSVALSGGNQENASFYRAFLNMEETGIKDLLSHIKILSSAQNITDTLEDIKKSIKYSCHYDHLNYVTERVEGWWFQEVIKALMSNQAVIMTNRQLHDKIIEISRQYGNDNLPIEFWNLESIEEADLETKDRLFLQQLRLIQSSSKVLEIAIGDYYRASKQRSKWIRQGLLVGNELDEYEYKLKDAWSRAFAEMEEDLQDMVDVTDTEKEQAGRKLYRKVSDLDIRIREKCDAAYVMHGTYHILANKLEVGWHLDFLKKLKDLLERS